MTHHIIKMFAYETEFSYNSTCQQKYENLPEDNR